MFSLKVLKVSLLSKKILDYVSFEEVPKVNQCSLLILAQMIGAFFPKL